MIEEPREEMASTNNGAQAKDARPHKYEDILNYFSTPIDPCPPGELLSKLKYPGIFDQQKKHRYWVDDNGKNCFMVYARALRITWGGNRRQWRWYPEKEIGDVSVDVAELLRAYWLEVHGFFETAYLTPGTKYKVSYVIKLTDSNSGWEEDVDFSLTLPQNQRSDQKVNKENLKQISKRDWSYIRVDEFTPGQPGKMDFMLRQPGKLKTGLIIKGVVIRPAN